MPPELKRRNLALIGEAMGPEVERYWAAPTNIQTAPR